MRSSPDVGRGCTPRRFGRMVPLRGEFGMAGHIITVTPHIRDGQKHPNAFDAYLGDRFVCTSETFSSARILLIKRLFPTDLQRMLWDLRERDDLTVLVQSEEPHIPWELCRLCGPLLNFTWVRLHF